MVYSAKRKLNVHVKQMNMQQPKQINSLEGRVVKASASGTVDLDLIPTWIKPMTLKLVFTLLFCLTLSIKGTVWRTSQQVYLLCR